MRFIYSPCFRARSISKKLRSKILLLCGLFSLLIIITLPFQPVYEGSAEITITATGSKSQSALGSEVWLTTATTNFLLHNNVSLVRGWTVRNGNLLSYDHQPAILKGRVSFKKGDKLIFGTHAYSGIVAITVNEKRIVLDLFSAKPSSTSVSLDSFVSPKLQKFSTAVKLVAQFSLVFLISLFVSLQIRAKNNVDCEIIRNDRASPKRVLLYSLPSFLIYGFSVLVYWPAQMSPDSLAQWAQIVSHSYEDAHPVLSTLFFSLPYYVYPSPASSVLFQSMIFAVVTGYLFCQIEPLQVSKILIGVLSVAFPLIIPNFLLVSTLWKDVPFGICLLFLTALSIRYARLGRDLTLSSLAVVTIVNLLIISFRYNGIFISVLYFLLLFLLSSTVKSKVWIASSLLSCCLYFIFLHTLFLTFTGTAPLPAQYRGIYGLYVISAMEHSNVHWSRDEQKVISAVLPLKDLSDSYNCEDVVPVFWNKNISWRNLAKNYEQINEIALNAVLHHPIIFLRHQICVSGNTWRIGPYPDGWVTISPMSIVRSSTSRELDLQESSFFPVAKNRIDRLYGAFVRNANVFLRPAIYLYISVFLMAAAFLRGWKKYFVVCAPGLFNSFSIGLVALSPDYRYVWPTLICALASILSSLGFLLKPRSVISCPERKDEAHEEGVRHGG